MVSIYKTHLTETRKYFVNVELQFVNIIVMMVVTFILIEKLRYFNAFLKSIITVIMSVNNAASANQ